MSEHESTPSYTNDVWKDRVRSVITFLSDENGYVIHKEACDYLIDMIVERLYTDRYQSEITLTPLCMSSLTMFLPNENSNVDKRTRVARIIAYKYYFYYAKKQCDNEWCDVKYDVKSEKNKNKNNAMELYRKDVVYCRNVLGM